MNKMNVEPVDRGHKLWQRIQLRLALAPVVIGCPIACEFAHRLELRALRFVAHRLPLRPLGRGDATAKVCEHLIGNIEMEGADFMCGRVRHRVELQSFELRHGVLPLSHSLGRAGADKKNEAESASGESDEHGAKSG